MKNNSQLRLFRDSISAKEGRRVTQGEFAERVGVSKALINAVEIGRPLTDNLVIQIFLTFGVWIREVNPATRYGRILLDNAKLRAEITELKRKHQQFRPDNAAWERRIIDGLNPVPKRVPQLKNHY